LCDNVVEVIPRNGSFAQAVKHIVEGGSDGADLVPAIHRSAPGHRRRFADIRDKTIQTLQWPGEIRIKRQ
jgi:hypothetical protein